MRSLWFVALLSLGACGRGKASGPAWPAPSTTAEDGGESLEPRETSTVAAALEKSEEPEDKKAEPAATPAAESPSDTGEKPAATPVPSPPIVDDVIMSDEIIIEIED
jgi:hypothetical protein